MVCCIEQTLSDTMKPVGLIASKHLLSARRSDMCHRYEVKYYFVVPSHSYLEHMQILLLQFFPRIKYVDLISSREVKAKVPEMKHNYELHNAREVVSKLSLSF